MPVDRISRRGAVSTGFPLEQAEMVARGIVEALRPHAERIEIAGSIRRRRPQVHDIDLVAIPRMTSIGSMFAPRDVRDTDFAHFFLRVLSGEDVVGEKILRGEVSLNVAGLPPRIQVDCYIATAETWATLLLIRTGSAEHNIRLCQLAGRLGGKLHADGSGLELPGEYNAVLQRQETNVFYPQSEEEIFARLGIAYLPPELREQGVTWQLTKSATEPQGRSA